MDSFEIIRNNVIYGYQENRNPFIDHPEYVDLIWDGLTSTGSIDAKELKVYPNPARDYLQIVLPDDEMATGSITSVSGKRVREFEGAENFMVSTNNINSGHYCVRVVSKGIKYQSKLVINE